MPRRTDDDERASILDRQSALAFLFGRIDYERTPPPYRSRTFKLDRMRQLAEQLGNPHRRYPILHVAGTKGKGSTSAMIASVLTAAGYRTGLYTSPHLDRIEERWTVDGRLCSETQLVQLIQTLAPVVQGLDARAREGGRGQRGPTYFEVTTAAALLHFARQQVDVAVLEVGLGGRLDSTNICLPEVAVITSISFDHTRQLGNSLTAIAGEKAGIVKPGVPVVTGVTQPEPREVIRRVAREQGSDCYCLGEDFFVDYHGGADAGGGPVSPAARPLSRIDYRESAARGGRRLEGLRVGLCGRHQSENAAVALAALQLLRPGVSEAAIRQGLATVRVPARFEVFAGSPTVVVDAAHNVASIAALRETLDEQFPDRSRPRSLVFATSQDKDVEGMLELLLDGFDRMILTRYLNNPRFVAPEQLLATVERLGARRSGRLPQLLVRPDPRSAWAAAERSSPAGVVCVAGSFFLAAEMRPLLQNRGAVPAVGVG